MDSGGTWQIDKKILRFSLIACCLVSSAFLATPPPEHDHLGGRSSGHVAGCDTGCVAYLAVGPTTSRISSRPAPERPSGCASRHRWSRRRLCCRRLFHRRSYCWWSSRHFPAHHQLSRCRLFHCRLYRWRSVRRWSAHHQSSRRRSAHHWSSRRRLSRSRPCCWSSRRGPSRRQLSPYRSPRYQSAHYRSARSGRPADGSFPSRPTAGRPSVGCPVACQNTLSSVILVFGAQLTSIHQKICTIHCHRWLELFLSPWRRGILSKAAEIR